MRSLHKAFDRTSPFMFLRIKKISKDKIRKKNISKISRQLIKECEEGQREIINLNMANVIS